MERKKIYDFDQAFDDRIALFMKKRGKKAGFTEEQWEDKIGELYQKFSATVIDAFGCTPKEYYSRMTGEELKEEICEHLKQNINIDAFLRAAAEEEKNRSALFELLQGTSQEAIFACSLLGDDATARDRYFELFCESEEENLKVLLADVFKDHADEFADRLITLYNKGKNQELIVDILSRCSVKTDGVYGVLLQAFRESDKVGEVAERLARYGDERALSALYERLQENLGYNDWRGVKYAVESLGGKVEERDFSQDKDYIKLKEEEARLEQERAQAK